MPFWYPLALTIVQVASNGFALCSNGLRVLASGVTISPSLVVAADGADITDNSMMMGGALSITNTAVTGTTLDVLSTLAGFTGNTIEGRFESGATGNLVNLFVGGTPAFQVRFHAVSGVFRILQSRTGLC